MWQILFDNFSTVEILEIKILLNMSNKIESLKAQVNFLKSCRLSNIFPISCNIKLDKKLVLFSNCDFILSFKKFVLKQFIRQIMGSLSNLIDRFKLGRRNLDFRKNFNYSILNCFIKWFRNKCEITYNNKYVKKFNWLVEKYRGKSFVKQKECQLGCFRNRSNVSSVLNLSDCVLNSSDLAILEKGPGFVPFHNKSVDCDFISAIECNSKISDEDKVSLQVILNRQLIKKEKFIFTPKKISLLRNRLKANDVILMKEDKGGRFVLLNNIDFKSKVSLELNNGKYAILNSDPGKNIKCKLIKIMKVMENKKILNRATYLSCYPSDYVAPKVFFNLKSHKDNFPLRCIFDFTGGIVNKISKFVINFFKDYINLGQFCVSSFFEAFNRINGFVLEDDCVFGSLDIENMYQSVNRLKSIDVFISILKKLNCFSVDNIKVFQDLLLLLEDSMYFMCNDVFYKIKEGWVIGYVISPLMCSVYIDFLECNVINQCSFSLKLFVRYVDDCLFVIQKEKLEEFLDGLNAFDSSINFTIEGGTFDFVKLKFLDLNVEKIDNVLFCSHFIKPKNLRNMIRPDSYQPFSHKRMSLLNFCWRNSRLNNFDNNANIQKSQFAADYVELGYNHEFIRNVVFNNSIYSHDINKGKLIVGKENEYMSLPFKSSVYNLVYKNSHLLGGMKVAWKKSSDLNSLLNSSKELIDNKSIPGIVYKIPCSCGKIYIGQSKFSLKERVKVHISRVKHKYKNSALYIHILNTGHVILFDNATVIFYERNEVKRRVKETLMIKLLESEAINLMKTSFDIKGSWFLK